MKIKITMFSYAVTILMPVLFAQHYTPKDKGSDISFSIKNFGLHVNGSFKGLKGNLTFNAVNPAASSFSASVDAATVNTGNGSRDSHLKKEEYLYVEKYPLISFVSTKITGTSKTGNLLMEGKITIRGITKVVSFPFRFTAKNEGYLFEGEFKINRRHFGVGGNSLVMSDNLTVSLSVFAN